MLDRREFVSASLRLATGSNQDVCAPGRIVDAANRYRAHFRKMAIVTLPRLCIGNSYEQPETVIIRKSGSRFVPTVMGQETCAVFVCVLCGKGAVMDCACGIPVNNGDAIAMAQLKLRCWLEHL